MKKVCIFLGLVLVGVNAFAAYFSDQHQSPHEARLRHHQSQLASQTKALPPLIKSIRIESGQTDYDVELVANTPYNRIRIIASQYPVTIGDITDLEHHELHIFQPGVRAASDQHIRLLIEVGDIDAVRFIGRGRLIAKGLDYQNFDLHIEGDIDAHLSGKRFGIRHFFAAGKARVFAKSLHTTHTNIEMRGQARANLRGEITLGDLQMSDAAWLDARWIRADIAKMRLRDSSQAFLAGIANILDVEAIDRSALNLRYLRANRGFVITRGRAQAKVWVREDLNTQALNKSDIYFYRNPAENNAMMADEGAVLDVSHVGENNNLHR